MTNVNDIYKYMCELAPLALKIGNDNVGLLAGNSQTPVSGVLVALDATSEVIEEAINTNAQLIVTHHPIIFGSIKNITDSDPTGLKLLHILSHGISVISMHTNMDVVSGGVNDILAKTVGLTDVKVLQDPTLAPDTGVCRYGTLPATTDIHTFANTTKQNLKANGLWYVDAGLPVIKVAVGGGSCGGYIQDVKDAGCDTFITADIKHSQVIEAMQVGLNLIDAGHFSTEDVVCPVIVDSLKHNFPDLRVKKSETLRCHKTFIAD